MECEELPTTSSPGIKRSARPLPMKDGLCSILEKKLDPVPVSVQTVSVAQKVVISRRKSKLSGMMGTKGHCETATAILTTPCSTRTNQQ